VAVRPARNPATGAAPAPPKRRGAVLAVALVALVALAYLWPFRLYGFEVVDEGTLLAQIDRATRGEAPYLDFETGYTPGYFALESALWRASGSDIVASRTFGVAVHVGTALLVFAVARAFAGTLIALAATAIELAFFLPVSLRFGAPFNIPYPGWFAAVLAIAAQAAVASVYGGVEGEDPRSGRFVRLALAGVAAGAAFSVKPNAGLFAAGGATLALVSGFEARARGTRLVVAVVALSAVLATIGLLLSAFDPLSGLALLAPVALAALRAIDGTPPRAARRARGDRPTLVAKPTSPPPGRSLGGAMRDLAALAAGFALIVLPWLVPLGLQLGLTHLQSDVFLLDGSVVRAFSIAFPPPEPATLALMIALAGAAALVFVGNESNRVVGELAALAVPWLLAGGLLAAALLAGEEGPRLAGENACLWLAPLALVVGLLGVPRRARYRGECALLCFAAIYQLQIYPRVDLIHAAMSAPPALVAAGATWSRLARRWRTALRGPRPNEGSRAPTLLRFTPLACTAVVIALAAGRAMPTFAARFTEPMVALDAGPRAPLVIDARYAADFAWLGETVRAVDAQSGSAEALFPFPDLAAIGFLARRPMPFRYIYFVPQRPDHAGERETIARLEAVRPKLAVVGPPRVAAFQGATEYFSSLVAYLHEHYCPSFETAQGSLLVRKAEGREADPCGG
jgi:hypothetical protein